MVKFGVIDESHFSLRSPRAIYEGPFKTLEKAFAEAGRMISDRMVEEVSVVRCRFSKRHECWVEVIEGSVTIDARSAPWVTEDEDGDTSEVATGGAS